MSEVRDYVNMIAYLVNAPTSEITARDKAFSLVTSNYTILSNKRNVNDLRKLIGLRTKLLVEANQGDLVLDGFKTTYLGDVRSTVLLLDLADEELTKNLSLNKRDLIRLLTVLNSEIARLFSLVVEELEIPCKIVLDEFINHQWSTKAAIITTLEEYSKLDKELPFGYAVPSKFLELDNLKNILDNDETFFTLVSKTNKLVIRQFMFEGYFPSYIKYSGMLSKDGRTLKRGKDYTNSEIQNRKISSINIFNSIANWVDKLEVFGQELTQKNKRITERDTANIVNSYTSVYQCFEQLYDCSKSNEGLLRDKYDTFKNYNTMVYIDLDNWKSHNHMLYGVLDRLSTIARNNRTRLQVKVFYNKNTKQFETDFIQLTDWSLDFEMISVIRPIKSKSPSDVVITGEIVRDKYEKGIENSILLSSDSDFVGLLYSGVKPIIIYTEDNVNDNYIATCEENGLIAVADSDFIKDWVDRLKLNMYLTLYREVYDKIPTDITSDEFFATAEQYVRVRTSNISELNIDHSEFRKVILPAIYNDLKKYQFNRNLAVCN